MTKKNKLCMILDYIEQFMILVSAITGCFSISALLVCITIGIASST